MPPAFFSVAAGAGQGIFAAPVAWVKQIVFCQVRGLVSFAPELGLQIIFSKFQSLSARYNRRYVRIARIRYTWFHPGTNSQFRTHTHRQQRAQTTNSNRFPSEVASDAAGSFRQCRSFPEIHTEKKNPVPLNIVNDEQRESGRSLMSGRKRLQSAIEQLPS